MFFSYTEGSFDVHTLCEARKLRYDPKLSVFVTFTKFWVSLAMFGSLVGRYNVLYRKTLNHRWDTTFFVYSVVQNQ